MLELVQAGLKALDLARISYLLTTSAVEAFRIVLDSSCVENATLLSFGNGARSFVDFDVTAPVFVGNFDAHIDELYHRPGG